MRGKGGIPPWVGGGGHAANKRPGWVEQASAADEQLATESQDQMWTGRGQAAALYTHLYVGLLRTGHGGNNRTEAGKQEVCEKSMVSTEMLKAFSFE